MTQDDDMRVQPWAARMAIRCVVGFYLVIAAVIAIALVAA